MSIGIFCITSLPLDHKCTTHTRANAPLGSTNLRPKTQPKTASENSHFAAFLCTNGKKQNIRENSVHEKTLQQSRKLKILISRSSSKSAIKALSKLTVKFWSIPNFLTRKFKNKGVFQCKRYTRGSSLYVLTFQKIIHFCRKA